MTAIPIAAIRIFQLLVGSLSKLIVDAHVADERRQHRAPDVSMEVWLQSTAQVHP